MIRWRFERDNEDQWVYINSNGWRVGFYKKKEIKPKMEECMDVLKSDRNESYLKTLEYKDEYGKISLRIVM